MKIGLLRHFKVDHHPPAWCDSEEYNGLVLEYDHSPIIPQSFNGAGEGYKVCYCSHLSRARETAEHVFDKEIIVKKALEEIPLRAIFNTRFKLPFRFWHIINRIGWARNSARAAETRKQSMERAARLLDEILTSSHENVLIVSHGLFMLSLQWELNNRGFKGKEFIYARHGELYEFSKN